MATTVPTFTAQERDLIRVNEYLNERIAALEAELAKAEQLRKDQVSILLATERNLEAELAAARKDAERISDWVDARTVEATGDVRSLLEDLRSELDAALGKGEAGS